LAQSNHFSVVYGIDSLTGRILTGSGTRKYISIN